jgi:hypothetical protein
MEYKAKCTRCGSEMTRKTTDDESLRKIAKDLGIPYGGSWICLTCYPAKAKECEVRK